MLNDPRNLLPKLNVSGSNLCMEFTLKIMFESVLIQKIRLCENNVRRRPDEKRYFRSRIVARYLPCQRGFGNGLSRAGRCVFSNKFKTYGSTKKAPSFFVLIVLYKFFRWIFFTSHCRPAIILRRRNRVHISCGTDRIAIIVPTPTHRSAGILIFRTVE